MRILITGGAGFIGANLARAALDAGAEVTILDNLATGSRENIDGLPVRFVEGSILVDADTADALDGVDSVIHLAARPSVGRSLADPLASHEVNATGTLRLLQAVRTAGVGHLITASSSSVYGMNPALPKNERAWIRPMSPYAVSKLASEQYTLAYQQSFGLDTLAFRFFNVYGPFQSSGHAYAAVIPAFVQALMAEEPLRLDGDGSQSRDFTYVGTVCRVLLDAATRKVSHGEPVNLAFGRRTSLLELIAQLESIIGRSATIDRAGPRPGDVKHSEADNTSLLSLFPDVEPVPLEEGLRNTAAWMETQS